MRCSEYQILISTYVDGKLDSHEEKELLSHLKVCRECHGTYEALLAIVKGCRQMEEVPVPTGLHQCVMQQIKEQEDRVSSMPRKKYWKWQYSGALVASLLVGIMFTSPLQILKEEQVEHNTAHIKMRRSAADLEQCNLEESEQPIHIGVAVKHKVDFERAIESFLEEQQIHYEKITEGYQLIEMVDTSAVMNWLEAYCETIYWYEVAQSSSIGKTLELTVEESS